MTIESLPAKCPSCGAPSKVKREHDQDVSHTWIECSACPMQTSKRGWLGDDSAIVDALVHAWNRRATQPKDGDLLALAETAEDAFRDDVLDALWKRGGNGDPVYMAANDFLLAYQRLRTLASRRVTVDDAMIYRAKQAWPGYYAPDTDDEWGTVLTAALQPDGEEE